MEFNVSNADDFAKYLSKDMFDSLSEEDQDKFLDTFIETCLKEQIIDEGNKKHITFNLATIDNGKAVKIPINEALKELGIDEVKNMIRDTIESDGISAKVLDNNKLDKIIADFFDGSIDTEDESMLFMGLKKAGIKDTDLDRFKELKGMGAPIHIKHAIKMLFLKGIIGDGASFMPNAQEIQDKDEENLLVSSDIMELLYDNYIDTVKSVAKDHRKTPRESIHSDKIIKELLGVREFLDPVVAMFMYGFLMDKNSKVRKLYCSGKSFEEILEEEIAEASPIVSLLIDYADEHKIKPDTMCFALLKLLQIVSLHTGINVANIPEGKSGLDVLKALMKITAVHYAGRPDFSKENQILKDNLDIKIDTEDSSNKEESKEDAADEFKETIKDESVSHDVVHWHDDGSNTEDSEVSPNGDKKESNDDKIDIRKILLDD